MEKRKAVFLDRDGTINVEVEYLSRIEEFQFIPGAPLAIKRLKDAGFLLVIVTNQSGIGRGYYDETTLERIHRFMHEELEKFGVGIDACYFCPHHPEHGVGDYRQSCNCRKPMPGMLLQAARDLNIDLSRSYIIGDKIADVKAGLNAGCTPILVHTGYGLKEAHRLPAGVSSYPDILSAAEAIIAESNEQPDSR